MYLGVDIGTSGVKVIVASRTGAVVARSTSALRVSNPVPGWSEQDPQDWWRATCAAVMQLDSDIRAKVEAIGLSGQMHGATLLDGQDRPLRPAILWNDGRSTAQCHAIESAVPESRVITGNLVMPGFTAPKLLWVREHEPQVFANVRSVLLPKDYVRLLMTGDKASDMSDSAGTLWLDVEKRCWSDTMLNATGLTQEHMPTLFEGSTATGKLLTEIAEQWGMERVPVAAGAGDNAAGAIGVGVISNGDGLLSLGTSGVIFVSTDSFRPNPANAVHAFCHALPDTWQQMSVHLSAASCIEWAAQQLGIGDVANFLALAEEAGAGSGPELFLPFLSGERTPHNDPHLRAGWLECDNLTRPERLACAVLEGVAFAHADGLAVLREAGTRVERLSVIGGGSRSRFWGRILASALNVRLDYLEGGDVGPAMGAAHLARMAATSEAPADVCKRPEIRETIDPDPELVELLTPKLTQYRQSIDLLKSR
ncbi:xylulokinase [Altererythrobacter ishigakiensis]|uniref:Xylulose kinase n=1 Tax=Altererythrobacter ishigakiensis TaxID=476157 RepID=A0A562ULY8_9SPHN|nr:xylulokinase [Altererythrobacter ishigakiensis]TWJ06651.1 xylulokinase [Altererythrobacter ishigakiensis]